MKRFSQRLERLRQGGIQALQNLTIVPLVGDGDAATGYRLLNDALSAGCTAVTELSDEGSVPELRFDNRCDTPVLLLDGEELAGAKQNRILNLSMLAAAGQSIVIPVSCVEQGRWRETSTTLASAKRTHFSQGRARKMAQVSFSSSTRGTRGSDQGTTVWSDIAEKPSRMDAVSETQAAAALYDRDRVSLRSRRPR